MCQCTLKNSTYWISISLADGSKYWVLIENGILKKWSAIRFELNKLYLCALKIGFTMHSLVWHKDWNIGHSVRMELCSNDLVVSSFTKLVF